jgi:hypothetical protein
MRFVDSRRCIVVTGTPVVDNNHNNLNPSKTNRGNQDTVYSKKHRLMIKFALGVCSRMLLCAATSWSAYWLLQEVTGTHGHPENLECQSERVNQNWQTKQLHLKSSGVVLRMPFACHTTHVELVRLYHVIIN